jgi:hypothetical protein
MHHECNTNVQIGRACCCSTTSDDCKLPCGLCYAKVFSAQPEFVCKVVAATASCRFLLPAPQQQQLTLSPTSVYRSASTTAAEAAGIQQHSSDNRVGQQMQDATWCQTTRASLVQPAVQSSVLQPLAATLQQCSIQTRFGRELANRVSSRPQSLNYMHTGSQRGHWSRIATH